MQRSGLKWKPQLDFSVDLRQPIEIFNFLKIPEDHSIKPSRRNACIGRYALIFSEKRQAICQISGYCQHTQMIQYRVLGTLNISVSPINSSKCVKQLQASEDH